MKAPQTPLSVARYSRYPVEIVCGADLVRGMARVIWKDDHPHTRIVGEAPAAYAGFSAYYCERIQWAARLLENDEQLARALFGSDLSRVWSICRGAFPALARKIPPQFGRRGCEDWSEAVGAAR